MLRYGNARELVLGLEVVLPDGQRLGRAARAAQGQHRLRPEAAVRRRRGHARHHHRRGAEALPACRGAPTTALGGRRRRRGGGASCCRAIGQVLGDRLLAASNWCRVTLALARGATILRRWPDPLPRSRWYRAGQADDAPDHAASRADVETTLRGR